MRGDERGQRNPWSLFAPVALAVLVGGVLAGLALRAIDAASGDAPAASAARGAPDAVHDAMAPVLAPEPQPEAMPSAASPEPVSQPESLPLPQPAVIEAAPDPAVARQEDAAVQHGVPVLPGPILARRDGAPAACINGTIALRDQNGWQQQLENDAPVPCVEGSPTAP